MKRLDDQDTHQVNAAKARGHAYQSVFEGKENCRWSEWKHTNAEAMFKHVGEVVFPFIKNLRNGEETLYSKYMKDAQFMIPKPSLLQEAVTLIDEIEVGDKPDVQGDIYEHLLGELKTAGKNGQFRTPRHIIRMMVELVNPEIGDRICDPACGTGGFLIGAYQHILKKYTSPDMVKVDPDGTPHNLIGDKITKKEHWGSLRKQTFYGFDFDLTMVRIALMNMILHGILEPNIEQVDTLSKRFEQKPIYEVLFANPPFAGSVNRSEINDDFSLDTSKTELLFVELFYNLLATGGKAAVIVPSGVLSTSSSLYVSTRKLLLENCDLQAVILMPSGVFQPYSTVVTAVLVFVKGGKTENVWFYEMNADGYSLDQRREFIDGSGNIPDIIERFKAGRTESARSFLVPFDRIKRSKYDLSPLKYKKPTPDEINYEEPEVLIEKISRLEEGVTRDLSAMRPAINATVFENLFESSADFRMERLEDLTQWITQGPNPDLRKEPKDGRYGFMKTKDVYDTTIHYGEINPLSKDEYDKYQKYALQNQDLLLAIVGFGSIGKVNTFDADKTKMKVIPSRALALIRVKRDRLNPEYLKYYFQSAMGRKAVENWIAGSTGQLVVKTSLIKSHMIPLPPLETQNEFVRIARGLERLRERRIESSHLIDELLASVVHKAFSTKPASLTRAQLSSPD
jgi:type I restriction enzyme M protein